MDTFAFGRGPEPRENSDDILDYMTKGTARAVGVKVNQEGS
jgi:hypothetical protein